jgi:hypothetical protein
LFYESSLDAPRTFFEEDTCGILGQLLVDLASFALDGHSEQLAGYVHEGAQELSSLRGVSHHAPCT